MSKKIAILGAGLSGLSAALTAIESGYEIEIFEKNSYLGGRVAHSNIDGFAIDHGFQVINMNYPEIRRLSVVSTVSSRSIFRKINFIDNEGVESFISPQKIGSLFSHSSGSIFHKFDFLMFLLFRTSPLVTMGEQRVRFKRLYDVLLAPFLSGVFLDDPINIRSTTAQRLCRSFVRGKPVIIDGGVGNLVQVLTESIPTAYINLNCEILTVTSKTLSEVEVTYVDHSTHIQSSKSFDYVVDATCSAPGDITGTAGGNAREWLSSTTVYHCSSAIAQMDDALFVGKKGVHHFVNTLAISQANESLAPEGKVLIATTYLGEVKEDDLHQDEGRLITEIAQVYGVSKADLELISIQYIPHSLPHFGRADSEDPFMGELDNRDPHNGLIFYAGDYLTDPSQNGALRSGREAVEAIKALLH